jgi:hypothetical protein
MPLINLNGGVSLQATLMHNPPSNTNVTGPLWGYELHVKPGDLRAAVGTALPGFDGKLSPYLRVPVAVTNGVVQRQMVPLHWQNTLSTPGVEDVYVDDARFTPAGHEPTSLVQQYGIDVYADTDQHGKTFKFPTEHSFQEM